MSVNYSPSLPKNAVMTGFVRRVIHGMVGQDGVSAGVFNSLSKGAGFTNCGHPLSRSQTPIPGPDRTAAEYTMIGIDLSSSFTYGVIHLCIGSFPQEVLYYNVHVCPTKSLPSAL